MINVAVIGAGAICSFHIEGYLAFPGRCRIVSVVDIDRAKAERQIERYHLDAVAADDIGAIVSGPGVDLASVCTPPGTHAEIAARLLDAGVHTLCEKPMATSLQDCDAILGAARHSGAVLSVVAQNRFTTPMARLKQVLDSGLAGRVLHAQVDSHWWRGPSYYDLWWRGTWLSEGGGCTLNHAVHHVDALQWMLGLPAEVQASIANVAHDNAEVDNMLGAIETGSADVLIDGHQGRGTLEIITAIYKAAITGAKVTLPLDDADPFCTRDGLLAGAPRFHEKTVSVSGFADNEITVTGAQR